MKGDHLEKTGAQEWKGEESFGEVKNRRLLAIELELHVECPNTCIEERGEEMGHMVKTKI